MLVLKIHCTEFILGWHSLFVRLHSHSIRHINPFFICVCVLCARLWTIFNSVSTITPWCIKKMKKEKSHIRSSERERGGGGREREKQSIASMNRSIQAHEERKTVCCTHIHCTANRHINGFEINVQSVFSTAASFNWFIRNVSLRACYFYDLKIGSSTEVEREREKKMLSTKIVIKLIWMQRWKNTPRTTIRTSNRTRLLWYRCMWAQAFDVNTFCSLKLNYKPKQLQMNVKWATHEENKTTNWKNWIGIIFLFCCCCSVRHFNFISFMSWENFLQ